MVLPDSMFLGIFFVAVFFAVSVITVIGIKSVMLAVRNVFKPKRNITPVKIKKRNKTPVRRIEINPDETTRIYVKKSS